MSSNPRRANGHRRDRVRRRVLREESVCWLCQYPVEKTLKTPHPGSPEVDEVVRVADGGSPIERSNCRLSHRLCNRYRDVPGGPPPDRFALITGRTIATRPNAPYETSRSW